VIDGSLQEAGKPDETGDESSPCEVDDRIASDVIDGSLQEAGKLDETGGSNSCVTAIRGFWLCRNVQQGANRDVVAVIRGG